MAEPVRLVQPGSMKRKLQHFWHLKDIHRHTLHILFTGPDNSLVIIFLLFVPISNIPDDGPDAK